jgi:hypothetical protein
MTTDFLAYALSGAIFMGLAVVGLFFLRFWRQTGDRLFAIFAMAFWVLTLERLLLLLIDPKDELRPYVYTVRLFAFLLILTAIIDKNRKQKP